MVSPIRWYRRDIILEHGAEPEGWVNGNQGKILQIPNTRADVRTLPPICTYSSDLDNVHDRQQPHHSNSDTGQTDGWHMCRNRTDASGNEPAACSLQGWVGCCALPATGVTLRGLFTRSGQRDSPVWGARVRVRGRGNLLHALAACALPLSISSGRPLGDVTASCPAGPRRGSGGTL